MADEELLRSGVEASARPLPGDRGRGGQEEPGKEARADVGPVVVEPGPKPRQVGGRGLRQHHELRDDLGLAQERRVDPLDPSAERRELLHRRLDAGRDRRLGTVQEVRHEPDP